MENDRELPDLTVGQNQRMKLGLRWRLIELRGERIQRELLQQRADTLTAQCVKLCDEEAARKLVEEVEDL